MTTFYYDDYRLSGETSTAIYAAYYNYDLTTLVIEFHGENRRRAAYAGVSRDVWNQYLAADSVGSFYNRNILGRGYPGVDANFDYFISAKNQPQEHSNDLPEIEYDVTLRFVGSSLEDLGKTLARLGITEDQIRKVESL